MTYKKLSLLLTLMAFLSVCFFVKPVWADPSAKDLTLHDSESFIKKGIINDNQLDDTLTKIWVFTTNGGKARNVPPDNPVKIKLTLIQVSPIEQTIKDKYELTIDSGQLSKSIEVIFPEVGQWKIVATTNDLDENKTVTYESDIFWVKHAISMTLSPAEARIRSGETQQYTSNLIFQDNTSQDISNRVDWTSSNETIAMINSNGLATGESEGTVTISAKDTVSGFSQNAQLIVDPAGKIGLEIIPISSKIGVGGTQQFQANFFFYWGDKRITLDVTNFISCTWTSSNTSVASISQSKVFSWNGGLATGLSPGKSTITAYFGLFKLTATANLEVEKLTLTPQAKTIYTGNTLQYVATLTQSDLQIVDVSDSVQSQWKSSDSSVVSVDNNGLVKGLLPGNTIITITFNNELSASANLNVQSEPIEQATIHHFGFVDSVGSPAKPSLILRYDVDPANATHSNWAYIGEPMLLDIYLQAYTDQGVQIKDYVWDTQWFRNIANWNIISSGSTLDPSKLSVSILSDPVVIGNSMLHAQLEIKQNDSISNKVIPNFNLTVKPKDNNGISTLQTTQAVVPGQGTTFTLYGGRVRVAQGYFYRVDGKAQVYVERYDGGNFVLNKDDSLTAVNTWDLSGTSNATPVSFQAGSGEVPVHSDTSNVTKTLRPSSYPSYLGVVEGTLTWGQIVDNPPPKDPLQQDNGPVWERELLP